MMALFQEGHLLAPMGSAVEVFRPLMAGGLEQVSRLTRREGV
jgi:hypothetical protein